MKCNIAGQLTIAAASDTKGQILQALANDGPFELDTSAVTEVDTAGLQVVLAALKSAEAARIPIHYPVELQGPAVASGLRLLGLEKRDWRHED